MFDFDAGKLIIIGIVALIVIGPKELPRVMRQVGQAAAKMRRMAAEFRGQFMDAMREADVEDIKTDVGKLAARAKIDAAFDPLAEIKAGITRSLEEADKPAALAAGDTTAIVAPVHPDSPLHAIDLPRLPETPGDGAQSHAAAGIAPATPEPSTGSASAKAPPAASATEAEMQALADALAAEIGEAAPPREASHGEKSENKV